MKRLALSAEIPTLMVMGKSICWTTFTDPRIDRMKNKPIRVWLYQRKAAWEYHSFRGFDGRLSGEVVAAYAAFARRRKGVLRKAGFTINFERPERVDGGRTVASVCSTNADCRLASPL